MTDVTDCLFCAIVAGDIPADVVASTERVLAFRDIGPQAPVHVLIIPREHYATVAALAGADAALAGELFALAGTIAVENGVAETGYRLVANTGAHGGQTVHHAHVHLLGGRGLSWPPG